MNTHPEAYSDRRLPVFLQNLRDRLNGQAVRANARMGYLRPPEGRGKLIWIRTGSSAYSVRVGAELLAAIRERRQDVRLVLTYEREFPAILETALRGVPKMGFGYSVCDLPSAVARSLHRLQPLGVIHAALEPGRNLSAALTKNKIIDASFPDPNGKEIDFRTLWVETQLEPTLAGLVRRSEDFPLWWWHGVRPQSVCGLLRQWSQTELAKNSYLFVSNINYAEMLDSFSGNDCALPVVSLRNWNRESLAPGTIIVVDDPTWRAAVAVAATAIQLQQGTAEDLWQAMAAGTPCSVGTGHSAHMSIKADIKLQEFEKVVDVFDVWQHLANHPFEVRSQGDKLRQMFWNFRRQASAALEAHLQQVYDW